MSTDPLISCIMPTAGRPRFVSLAVRYFLRQRHPHRELIVVDDGPDRIDHLLPVVPSVRYCRLGSRRRLGEKRNIACDLARGDFIAHWDDDDWTAPTRLSTQLRRLEAGHAGGCGHSAIRFFDPSRGMAWRWRGSADVWLAGGCLFYQKAVWTATPFRPLAAGEDMVFLHEAGAARFLDLGEADDYVAVIHGGNTSSRPGLGPGWSTLPVDEVSCLLGDDVRLYESPASCALRLPAQRAAR